LGEKCVTLEVEGVRQKDRPRETWKNVVDSDMNDLHLKPSDAMDHHEWKEVIGGNWSNSSSDGDATSCI